MLTVSQQRQQSKRNFILVVAGQLGWPLIWGMAAWVAFFTLVRQGAISHPLIDQYLAGHPIEYVETAMFFVGLAALGIKLLDVLHQHSTLDRVRIPTADETNSRPEDSGALLAELAQLPARLADSYLVRRLREALQYVQRKGSADELDEQLRYLSDVDAARQHDGFALSRLIIWAIPILGFLGTVIGITLAITNLSPEQLAAREGVDALTHNLGVAFNTTATALALSMVLMFASFLIERIETELLAAVDERAADALVGRFEQLGGGTDPQVKSIRKMTDAVIHASEKLVARQAELWQGTIDSAHQQWSSLSGAAAQQTQQALEAALTNSLNRHAEHIAAAERQAGERTEQLSQRLAAAMISYAKATQHQQAELARQGEIMQRAIEASGKVTSLQEALNNNLNALAGAKNFEDTVMSLAAAIHLLNTRLGEGPRAAGVQLESPAAEQHQGRAA